MNNYIYLLQEREFIKTKEPIYKIGKTKQDAMKRINQYPKGSLCLLHINCDDCDKKESELINIFKNKYEWMQNIGNEYFKGDSINMIEDIFNYIKNNNSKSVLKNTCSTTISNHKQIKIKFNSMNEIFEINSNIYSCLLCKKEYNSYMGAWKHKNKKHNDIEKKEINNKVCKYCDKEFSDRQSRWRHENTICKLKLENKRT